MWKIKYFRLCMLELCLLLMWYGSAACQKKMEWFDNSVSVRWESGMGVSPAQMSQVLERQIKAGGELPSFVLWMSHYEQILYGDFYPNPVNGEVFEYYGDISRLQLCRVRYGYWPGDEKGCVIDEGTAHALWGSSDVLGQMIKWNERTWYVCGVVEGMDGLAFFPAEETEERMFQGLWLNLSEEQGGTYAAEQILQKYQLPVGDMTDLGLYVWLSGILAALPAFLLWAWVLMCIAHRLWKLRYTWLLFLMSVPLMFAGTTAISWTVGFPWSVPARFLPTRWSDGSFWGRLCVQIRDGILAIFRMPPVAWERTFWITFLLGGILSVWTILFLWLVVRRLPVAVPKNILRISLIWWGGLLCIIWKNKDSLSGNPSVTLWILPTVWMTIRWLLDLHDKMLGTENYLNQGGNEIVFIEEKTKS